MSHKVSLVRRYFHQGLWRPRSADTRQDWRIVRAVLAVRRASREIIRSHSAPAAYQRIIGNPLLAAELRSRVPLTRLQLTPRHRQGRLLCCRQIIYWRLEWRSVGFSDGNRFRLYASDGRTRVRHRPGDCHGSECIFPRHTSVFMVWRRAISYNWCFCRESKQCPLHCTGC